MVSKGSAGPPPAAKQSSSTECCMCGDLGLAEELFRCKVCLVRSQHKYCSNLYPKSEIYRACNWCLSEEAAKLPKEGSSKETSSSSSIPVTKNDSSSSNKIGYCSGAAPAGLKLRPENMSQHHDLMNKPIKKLRMLERSASDITDRLRSEALSSPRLAGSRSGKQVFRGKVRRYKLLEEVSS